MSRKSTKPGDSEKSKAKKNRRPAGTWKAAERRVSTFLGTTRTPLSGGNSKVTRSDTFHPDLFVENKYRKSCAVRTLFDKTKKLGDQESKVSILTLQQANKSGFLIVIHSEDLDTVMLHLRKARKDALGRSPQGMDTLFTVPSLKVEKPNMSVPWDDPG